MAGITGDVGSVHRESDGQGVDVDLLYTVVKDRVVYVDGWLGFTWEDGDSGDTIALNVEDGSEWAIELPTAVAAVKGEEIFITVATLTGHYPDDAAFTKSAGAGKVKLGKVTKSQDANDVAHIKFGGGQVAS
jgi:hypothetical protein